MLNTSIKKLALATGVVALAGLATPARADCDANGNTVTGSTTVCYHLKGSDTLFDIVTQSIKNAKGASVVGAESLFYDGTGSGNAENQMKQLSNANADLGVQSIGPMSRNMRPGTIDSAATVVGAITGTFVQRDLAANIGKSGHAAWAPVCQNVVGLDAAVFVTKATGVGSGLNDIDFNVFTNNYASPASFKQGASNGCTGSTTATCLGGVANGNFPTDFTNGTAFNNLASAVNYNSLWSIVLSGVDGSGSLKACSDPRRIRALQDLSTALGVPQLDHIYRRDDNSGTTDTIKDRIMVVSSFGPQDSRYPWTGGRFCNGQAVGGIAGATAQTGICSVTRTIVTCKLNSDCPAGEVCQFNLNNQDLDPVRRPCIAADADHAPTSCTDVTTGKPCQATDGNANCSQGLVVALSDTDPFSTSTKPSTDVTTSIANRIRNGGGAVIGYAGREAASGGVYGTKAIKVNGVKPTDTNVRNSSYLLARRLFLQNSYFNPANGNTTGGDVPDDKATGISITGGGAQQITFEQNLFNYMTNRANTDPVVAQFNFITCSYNGVGVDPCGESNNLCALGAPATPPPYDAGFPNTSFNNDGTGGAKSLDSAGNLWNGSSAPSPATCSVAASGKVNACVTDGSICTSSTATACPPANGRLANSACSQTSDCATGLTCKDALGLGPAPYSLVCAP
jgi:hypothetical protein